MDELKDMSNDEVRQFYAELWHIIMSGVYTIRELMQFEFCEHEMKVRKI